MDILSSHLKILSIVKDIILEGLNFFIQEIYTQIWKHQYDLLVQKQYLMNLL